MSEIKINTKFFLCDKDLPLSVAKIVLDYTNYETDVEHNKLYYKISTSNLLSM